MVIRPDVVGVGEAMVLLQPAQGADLATAERMDVHVGGAELNVCAAVARLGGTAWFASRVGADPFGERVLNAARALSVGTSLVGRDSARPTGVFFKEVRPDGARRVHYYRSGSAASGMDEGDAPAILATRPRAIVVSGITIALGEGPERLVRALADGVREAGALLVVDPNLRPSLGRQDRVLETVRELLPLTDLLVLGQDEAEPLFGTTDPAAVFAAASTAWAAAGRNLDGSTEGPDFAGNAVSGGETARGVVGDFAQEIGRGDDRAAGGDVARGAGESARGAEPEAFAGVAQEAGPEGREGLLGSWAPVGRGIEVVLKAGAEGVYCLGADGAPVHLPSAARVVRDPVGAGDALLGGYLAARLAGAGPERAAWVGSELAGRIVEVYGDVEGLPSPAEAAALLRR
ncbi:sugar kinase [Nonomuraea africana]|uniref:sugar kinase n=1 Tax=Nonomuraea africana TaxID=46171 RepID=UPI0033DCC596